LLLIIICQIWVILRNMEDYFWSLIFTILHLYINIDSVIFFINNFSWLGFWTLSRRLNMYFHGLGRLNMLYRSNYDATSKHLIFFAMIDYLTNSWFWKLNMNSFFFLWESHVANSPKTILILESHFNHIFRKRKLSISIWFVLE
jgi:hypothetical protein